MTEDATFAERRATAADYWANFHKGFDQTRTGWGEYWSGVHDDWLGDEIDADCLSVLVDLAAGGPVLELGLGTGRVAIPLVRAGLTVHGYELSDSMIEKLRAKPLGDRITVIKENYIDSPAEGRYTLVPWLDWGPFLMRSQDEQLRCFQNVANHLEEGGFFVIEMPTRVPLADGHRPGNQHLVVETVSPTCVGLWAVDYDPISQNMLTQQIRMENGSIQMQAVAMRYASAMELDLLARLVGLQLRYRWGDWKRGPVTADSNAHISVYQKPASS